MSDTPDPDPRLDAESLAIREALYRKPTFCASLVRMEVRNKLLRELVFSNPETIAHAKLDMAYSLANFLVKEFCTETKADQHIELKLSLELIVPTDKVPEGVAHTPIIFQENKP